MHDVIQSDNACKVVIMVGAMLGNNGYKNILIWRKEKDGVN
jgi:hypothetical protein